MIGDTACCGRPAVAGSAVAAEYGCGAFAAAVAAAACAFKKEKRKKGIYSSFTTQEGQGLQYVTI